MKSIIVITAKNTSNIWLIELFFAKRNQVSSKWSRWDFECSSSKCHNSSRGGGFFNCDAMKDFSGMKKNQLNECTMIKCYRKFSNLFHFSYHSKITFIKITSWSLHLLIEKMHFRDKKRKFSADIFLIDIFSSSASQCTS